MNLSHPTPDSDSPSIRRGSVSFGFGLITCQKTSLDARSYEELYREAIEIAVVAEQLGFDSVWLSEHHFFDDGYMPSLLPMAAAIAARTTRIQIGTAVLLAPLYNPVRLAEDAACVDLISGGRLLLGLGSGWRKREFEVIGTPLESRHRRLWETIDVLKRAWSGTYDPALPVTPTPSRDGGPPIWVGAGKERAIRLIGQSADGYLGNYYIGPSQFAEQVQWLKRSIDVAGRDPSDVAVSIQLPTFADDSKNPWTAVRQSVHHVMAKYDQHASDDEPDAPQMIVPAPMTAADDERLQGLGLFGSSQYVAEGIGKYHDAAAGDLHFVARLYWPGLSFDEQIKAMNTFADRVMPNFPRPKAS